MIDPKIAYNMAKFWAENKVAQAMPGGGVLTAGVVIIALLIVFSALTDRRGERFCRYHDSEQHAASHSISQYLSTLPIDAKFSQRYGYSILDVRSSNNCVNCGSNYRTFAFEFPWWRQNRRVKPTITSDTPVKPGGGLTPLPFFGKQKCLKTQNLHGK